MSFTSPMKGRYTSDFGNRPVYGFHAGLDIAPPIPGTVGSPVYAASSGTIVRIVRGRKLGQPASSGRTIAPGRSGDGGLIAVGSGRHLYNHVAILSSLSVGSKVVQGQLIGHTNRTGIQSGPHLHFETWRTSSPSSYYNPITLFNKAGISVGSTPRKASSGSGSYGLSVQKIKDIQSAMKRLGHYDGRIDGSYGSMTKAAVRSYQKKGGLYQDGIWGPKTQAYYNAHDKLGSKPKPKPTSGWARSKSSATAIVKKMGYSSISRYQAAQRCPLGLKPDGIWGAKTESHYRETKKMQEAMNGWKDYDILVDGDYGSKTVARVRDLKARNKGGAWKGSVNSNPDRAFMNMLKIGEYHNHK